MKVRDLIKSKNLTQEGFSKVCGVDTRTVERWCAANKMPKYAQIILTNYDTLVLTSKDNNL